MSKFKLDPRIAAAGERLKKFAYGNKNLYVTLWVFWLLLSAVNLTLVEGTQKLVAYAAVVLIGELVGWLIAYAAIKLFHIGSKKGSTPLLIASSASLVLACIIILFVPFYWQWLVSYNHAVYLCMVDRGETVRTACDRIVSQIYQARPGQLFYQYP